MTAFVPTIGYSTPGYTPLPDAEFLQLKRYRLRIRGPKRLKDFAAKDQAEALCETKRVLEIKGELTVAKFQAAGGISVRELPDGPQVYPPVKH